MLNGNSVQNSEELNRNKVGLPVTIKYMCWIPPTHREYVSPSILWGKGQFMQYHEICEYMYASAILCAILDHLQSPITTEAMIPYKNFSKFPSKNLHTCFRKFHVKDLIY